MKTKANYAINLQAVFLLALPLFVTGCSSVVTKTSLQEVSSGEETFASDSRFQSAKDRMIARGEAEYAWEEPMIDVVEVPAGLDPEGHYYRPAHKAVVEIRQGRWMHYKDVVPANK